MNQSRSSPFSKALAALCVGLLASVHGNAIQAQELGHGVQAHGFISQSLVYTSDNNVGGSSDDALASNLRELGANLSWRPTPDWLISGQALARWAGESDRGELRLDYGFVDRTLFANGEDQVGLRAGKIKNPYGFFNTTRDVAHTRPGIIMPQSIYLDRIRNFLLSAPGVAAYGNHAGDKVEASWSLGAVRFDADDADLERLFLLDDRPGKLASDTSWLGQVMTEIDGGRWRIGLTLGEVNMHFDPSAAMASQPAFLQLARGRNRLTPYVLSLEHNAEKYSLTGEYSQVRHESRDYASSPLNILAIGLQKPNTIEAWYLQATYRPSPDWRIYLRRDEIYLDKEDKEGTRNPNPLYPAYATFSKDWTVGARYDLNAWSFSAEYHKVDGTLWLSPLDTPLPSQKERWNMLLLQAAWRF
jgi:hypothetical protein